MKISDWETIEGNEELENWREGLVLQCPECKLHNYLASLIFSRPTKCLMCGYDLDIRVQVKYPDKDSTNGDKQ